MKKFKVADIPPALLPPFAAESLVRISRRKPIRKLSSSPPPPPPNEETVKKLNRIGHQYPFCVYYREKNHDPL